LDKKPDVADWFYMPYWKPTFSPRMGEPEGAIGQAQRWLMFVDECGVGSQIALRLEREGREVIKVLAGDRFDKLDDRAYTIDARERNHYVALLEELRKSDSLPQIVLHLWTVTPEGAADPGSSLDEKIQTRGFYSLLLLAQAIGEERGAGSIQIAVVSNDMQKVTGEERLVPEKATVLGPCSVIPQEYTNLSCRTIDISLPPPGSLQWDRLVTRLINDITSASADRVLAYRNDIRWTQAFEPVRIENRSRQSTILRRHGVYLITGGLGGLGLALAEYLARTVQARLVLIGRSALPAKEEWDRYNEQDRLSDRIRKIKALEDLGAEVEILRADVADYQEMRAAVDRARERFGRIHGVIHAAGVPGAGLIQLKTIEKAAEVLYPKVNGALVLQRVFQGEPLDFIALYSTNTSIIGGLGQVDYCAANAFLDAFAHSHTIRSGVPTVSIDWCAWQWDDWQEALTGVIPEAQAEFSRLREAYGLTFAEGTEAFSRVLSAGAPQVVVSTQDFQSVRELHNKFAAQDFVKHLTDARSSITSHPRPALETDYVPPGSDAERRIVQIWQELLGIEQIGVHDNFFHLGGHSLLGIHLISRLEESFQVSPPLRSLFERPTIAGLSLLIEEMLIAEIDSLTEEEARLLGGKR
jgi:NAD(P)-dependent dehydrogenase (short-subunit alcohol dehydrogenase family)/acyl carrier protein